MSAGNGFALDEYVTPRCGPGDAFVPGGTMPKGPSEVGSCFAQINKAAKGPGPEHYNKDHLHKSFAGGARGGPFSKLDRKEMAKAKGPAVGQYETECDLTKKSIKGGSMSKRDRGCQFLDIAIAHSKWCPSPDKYENVMQEKRVACPNFQSTKTDSRHPSRVPQVGPGYYDINLLPTEKTSISYSSSKEPMKSYFERISQQKAKTPAPGHNGIPESKVEDQGGRRKHTKKLLIDRLVLPRSSRLGGPASARGAQTRSLSARSGGIGTEAAPAAPGALSAR